MTTGERIRQLRIQHQMTQEELGAKVGVQKAAIYKYENGLVVNLKRSTLEKLALVLETTPTYLMGLEDDETAPDNLAFQQSALLENLNRLKKSSGMTIEQIATASGVPKGTLNKLFAGQTKDPQLSTVSAVVHCMGYTLDDLSDDTVSGKIGLDPQQSALLLSFDQLNAEGQQKAVDYVDDLVLTGRYKKCAASGLGAKEA